MRQLICRRTCEWLEIGYTYRGVRISYLVRLAEVAHIHIGYCKITTCYRARPDKRAQRCSVSSIFIYLYYTSPHVLFGPARAPRNAQRANVGRLRFKGQYNRLENGYFSSKPWLEIGSSYEAADLPTYL